MNDIIILDHISMIDNNTDSPVLTDHLSNIDKKITLIMNKLRSSHFDGVEKTRKEKINKIFNAK